MSQPPPNNLPQCQVKKTGRKTAEVSQYFGNGKKQKNTPNSGNSNKTSVRKPLKGYNKHLNSGQRERTFSKNERKIGEGSRNEYMDQNFQFSDSFAPHNLLNFHYSSSRTNVAATNSKSYQLSRRKKTFFNKEAYLQAKCQFVVTGSADDYLMNAHDPDKLVDWEKIHLVYFPSHESPNCPICLYSPVAAKITKCGHIFCWNCMLHYLHLNDQAWSKCPICHEAVHKKDLKSVESYTQRRYTRLDPISMKLMKRPKDCVFVSMANESGVMNAEFSPWIDNASQSYNFGSKLMLASPAEVVHHILMRQRNELIVELNNNIAEENGEDVFIKMALEILEEEIKSFKLEDGSDTVSSKPVESEQEDTQGELNVTTLSDMLNNFSVSRTFVEEAAFSDDEFSPDTTTDFQPAQENVSETPAVDHSCSGRVSESSDSFECSGLDYGKDVISPYAQSPSNCQETPQMSDSYFFYQVGDGQNIFLHSLNARCLVEEYGSLNYGPDRIDGQIIDFECYTMTKELRKRFRYLSHLPLCSEFMICELILKPPVLSKNTIHNFMPEFKSRKASRLKKFKEQQKHDRLATAAGNKQHGFRNICDYDDDEDDIGIDLSNIVDFPSNISPDAESNVSPDAVSPTQQQEQFHGISFAQMLNKKTEITPPPQEHVNHTVNPRFRGFEILRPSHEQPTTRDQLNTPQNEDDDCPNVVRPDFRDTFSAAMFAAPIKSEHQHPLEEQPVVEGSKKKRNKKNKGMLLFGTAGQRKY